MLTKTQRSYFKAARAMSELSDFPRRKHGCVIVDKHRIVSSGYNSSTKCDSLQAKMDIEKYGEFCPGKVHAESAALAPILRKKIKLSNAEIYMYREDREGNLALSRPCSTCMKMIKQAGIRYINYTTKDGYAFETLEV